MRHFGEGVRVVLGVAVLGASAALVRQGTVSPLEAALSRRANRLPSALNGPMWVAMQGGSLPAVFVTGGVAFLAGRRRLSRRVVGIGILAWTAARIVKVRFGRPRPDVLLRDVIVRGTPATGIGFPSGHAAVATALAATAASCLPRRGRRLALVEVALVAVARVYSGAHLPLDVVGGAALGWTLASGLNLVRGRPPAAASRRTARRQRVVPR